MWLPATQLTAGPSTRLVVSLPSHIRYGSAFLCSCMMANQDSYLYLGIFFLNLGHESIHPPRHMRFSSKFACGETAR